MPAKPGPSFEEMSSHWLELSERRLAYYTQLYQSGRWLRYYTPEAYAERVVDVMKAVSVWRKLADRESATDTNDLRPVA